MNRVIQSFTPVVKPLDYDATAAVNGCEDLIPSPLYASKGFNRICVAERGSGFEFNKADTEDVAKGPLVKRITDSIATQVLGTFPPPNYWSILARSEGPFLCVSGPSAAQLTLWDDSSDAGLYYQALTLVNPPDSTPIPLGKVSLAYSATGRMLLAGSSGEGFLSVVAINLAHDDLPDTYRTTRVLDAINSPGLSPVLFATSELTGTPVNSLAVLFHLSASDPRAIFIRYEEEGFAIQRRVLSDIRIPIERLISARAEEGKLVLRAVSRDGRDVTFYSPLYAVEFENNASLDTAFVGGEIFDPYKDTDPLANSCAIAIAFAGGYVFDATAETEAIPSEAATVLTALSGGDIIQTL